MNEVDTDARPHHCVTVYQSVRYSPVSNKLQSLGTLWVQKSQGFG